MSGRYRKLLVKMWGDEKFRNFSRPHPNGQSLFIYLITGPHTNPIPGLFHASELGLADALGWSLEGFREAFQEVFLKGMVKADWKAHLVFLPKAIVHNKPESPNVVKSWAATFDTLPECALREEAFQVLKEFVEGMGEGFAKAFGEAFKEGFKEGLPKAYALSGAGAGNRSRKQEQEAGAGEVLKSTSSSSEIENSGNSTATAGRDVARPIPKISSNGRNGHKAPATTEAVWSAYCGSYRARYGVPPVRNASVNGQLAHFMKRLPAEEAPEVVKFYVQSQNQFYVQHAHSVTYLLRDAEKLRTEWATGKRITATRARSGDQREERGNIGQHLLDKAAKQREGSHA